MSRGTLQAFIPILFTVLLKERARENFSRAGSTREGVRALNTPLYMSSACPGTIAK